jgi:hypothetical protein
MWLLSTVKNCWLDNRCSISSSGRNSLVHYNLCSSPDIIKQIKSKRLRWAGHVVRMGEKRKECSVLVGKPERDPSEDRGLVGSLGSKWIVMTLAGGVEWIQLAQNRDRWRALVNVMMNLLVLVRRIHLVHCIQTNRSSVPSWIFIGCRGSFIGCEAPWGVTYYSLPSDFKVKKAWSFVSTPPHVFIALCVVTRTILHLTLICICERLRRDFCFEWNFIFSYM